MRPGRVAAIMALAGGLLWIAVAVAVLGVHARILADAHPLANLTTLADTQPLLYDLGLAASLIALAGLGYSLVDHAPWWLRLIVSIATPMLGLTGWIMVRDIAPSNPLVVLVAGIGLLLGGLIAFPHTRRAPLHHTPAHGHRATHRRY